MDERKKNIIIALSLGILATALSLALYIARLWQHPIIRIRPLAETILRNTYNTYNETLTSYSLNAVSAVIWDYRGIDTIFETTVLLASVIAALSLLGVSEQIKTVIESDMGIIARFSTKLVLLITTLIAISTAIHGHISPGGGFQAGAMLTVLIALIIPVYSITAIYRIGFKKETIILLRYFALLLIAFIALIPPLLIPAFGYAYIMQNQYKENSQFYMPAWFADTPLGGSIFLYNILETVAVAVALSYVIILVCTYVVSE